VYPEIPDGPITELWHADKWLKEIDPNLLTPMFVQSSSRHFYIQELATLTSGLFVIPVRWIMFQNALHAQAWMVSIDESVSLYFNSCIL
jgi:hypothetical protein